MRLRSCEAVRRRDELFQLEHLHGVRQADHGSSCLSRVLGIPNTSTAQIKEEEQVLVLMERFRALCDVGHDEEERLHHRALSLLEVRKGVPQLVLLLRLRLGLEAELVKGRIPVAR